MFEYIKSAVDNGTIVVVPTMGGNNKGTTVRWKELTKTTFNDIKNKKAVLIKIPQYTDEDLFKFVVIDIDGRKFSQKNTDFTFETVNILFNKLYNHLINLGWEEGTDFLTVTTANGKKHFYIAVEPSKDDEEVVSKQNNHLLKHFKYGEGPLQGEHISNDVELFGYHSQSLIMAPESEFTYGTYIANTEFNLESLAPKTYLTVVNTVKDAFNDWYEPEEQTQSSTTSDGLNESTLSFFKFDEEQSYERKRIQDFNIKNLANLILEAFKINGMAKHQFEIAICEYLGNYLFQDQLEEVKKLILKNAPENLFNDIINFNTNWIVNEDAEQKTGLKTALQLINTQKGGDYAQRWQNKFLMAMEYSYYILPIIDPQRARNGSRIKGFYVSHRGIAEETFEVYAKDGEKPFLVQTGVRENVLHDNMVISITESISDIQVTEEERVFSIVEKIGDSVTSYQYTLKRFKNQYQGFERFLVLAAANGYVETINAPAYLGFYMDSDKVIQKYDKTKDNHMAYIEPVCPLQQDVKNAVNLYFDICEAVGLEDKVAIGSFIIGTVIPFGYLFRQNLKRLMPTLILAGRAGTGKSIIAKALSNFHQTIIPRKITYGPGDVSTAFGFVHNCMEPSTLTCVIDEADKVLTPGTDHYNIFKDSAEKIDVRETTWHKSYSRNIPILTTNLFIEQTEETAPILRRNVCYNLLGREEFDPDTIAKNLTAVVDKDGMYGVKLSELGAIGEYVYYFLHTYFQTPRTGNVLQIAEDIVKNMLEYAGATDNIIYTYLIGGLEKDIYSPEDNVSNVLQNSNEIIVSTFYDILRNEFLQFRNSYASQRSEFLEASNPKELFKLRIIKGLHPWISYMQSKTKEKYYIKDTILTTIIKTSRMFDNSSSVMTKRRVIKEALQQNSGGVIYKNGRSIRAIEIDIDDLMDNIL